MLQTMLQTAHYMGARTSSFSSPASSHTTGNPSASAPPVTAPPATTIPVTAPPVTASTPT